ncbi:MAG: hypothetical protein OEQ13_08860, partial [Acidobacteriota bacterium]|nr:hypothetical protein [Acidobacteriota bacterium]
MPERSSALVNGGFETAKEDEPAAGWFMPAVLSAAGHSFRFTEHEPFAGGRCAELSRASGNASGDFANMMQVLEATPFRGKIVRLSAAVRVDGQGPGDRAQMWLRVDRPGGRMGFFDNMGDRPITGREWERYEIVGLVEEDAERINVGLMKFGAGRAFLDDVELEVLGEPAAAAAAPRPLAPRGLVNLVALTRLLGYVRYFHPSDEAAAADWEDIALRGVRAVEGADSPGRLATALEALMRPVAPSVRVVPTGEELPALDLGASDDRASELAILSWLHRGLGSSGGGSVYRSERVERAADGAVDEARDGAVDLYRVVDPEPYRGKRLRLVSSLRVDDATGAGAAKLGLGIARPGKPLTYASGEEVTAADEASWREVALEGDVPEDASVINLGVHVTGQASVSLDAVRLEVRDQDSGWRRLAAFDFEHGTLNTDPLGWRFQATRGLVLYEIEIVEGEARSGGRYASVIGRMHEGTKVPDPRRPFVADLGGGVTARVPLALLKDDRGTLPRADRASGGEPDESPVARWMTARDRTTRLAAVALGWNVFQHFYPYFDAVETDWAGALTTALRKAAADPGEREFLDTLRGMVAALDDGHGRVRHSADQDAFGPPLLWEIVEGRHVVTHVDPVAGEELYLQPGDEILAVGGRPIAELVRERGALISSATEQWRRARLYRELLAGERDTSVTLTVRSAGGRPR